jgi:hypothetical protein
MRNKLKLADTLRNFGISHTIFELKSGCLGISHDKKHKRKVADIAELLGYVALEPYQYEYSYKEKPLGATIIY